MLFAILIGCMFVFTGIIMYKSNTVEPYSFWANAKSPCFEVTDVRRYNRAVSKLWIGYGISIMVFSFPMGLGQNNPWAFISVLGMMISTLLLIIVYTLVIEKRYRKR